MAERGGTSDSMTSRRKARKRALDVLYEADLMDHALLGVFANYLERMPVPRPPHLSYTKTLIEGIDTHLARIDEVISSYAEGWTLDRMPIIDRNLARIAVFELLYCGDVDSPVAISEAVELAEALSTDDSPRFLNGLLGRVADFAQP